MSECYFCKKEYEGYPVILDSCVECFLMEQHIKDIYYNETKGVCKKCRDREFYDNPVWKIRAWLTVKAQLMCASADAKKDKEMKKKYEDAIKRIEVYEAKLEKTPQVQALYRQNDPASYKEKLKYHKQCTYCGDNKGGCWVNNPNDEPRDDNCWWVCIPCSKIIPLQQDMSWAMMGLDMAKNDKSKKHFQERVDKLKKQIKEVAFEDGTEVCAYEIKRKEDGYESKRVI